MLAFFLLLAVAYALPQGNLSPGQIADAKKRCQANCAHVSAKGRGVVLHNRCVQTCWNEFFQSMTNQHPVPAPAHVLHKAPQVFVPKPKPKQSPAAAVMHNVMGTKRSILNSGHNRMVHTSGRGRGMPVAGARLAYAGVLIMGALMAALVLL